VERSILDAIDAAAAAGEQAAVATVVSTFGSAPRQPGAKYLVTESGRYVGSVSGGCVESDVAERAQQVFAGSPANLIHYGVSDDDAFEVGLSRGGKIDVWIERADPEFWCGVRAVLA
jgi:xanthine dehydrogenase accessory factor